MAISLASQYWQARAKVRQCEPLARAYRTLRIVQALPHRHKLDLTAINLIAKAKAHSQVGCARLANVYTLAKQLDDQGVPGSFVECGVWKGGCAAVLVFAALHGRLKRRVWLFDSFEGMPEATPEDGDAASGLAMGRFDGRLEPVGTNVATVDGVKHLFFRTFGFPESLVLFKQGWFQDTLPIVSPTMEPIALLRIDGDWYASTRVCLEHLYDRVTPGGYVVIDDYGLFPGCRRAVDEFLHERGIAVTIHQIDDEGVYFRKPSPE